ncbi:MAG: aminoacyl-tRNA hydrolase [Mariprofundaceae bacterium]
MKLLVGLGNPGDKYRDTRHNIGFRFVDKLANSEGLRFSAAPRFRAESCSWESNNGKVILIKPQTFMNDSGESIGPLMRYYQVESHDIVVIYDDLDLPVGKVRIKKGGGHGGHNGLRSLNQHLPDANYIRIKIGIGRPDHGNITPWVLGKACEKDQIWEQQIFDVLLNEINNILDGDTDKSGNRIHLALQEKE